MAAFIPSTYNVFPGWRRVNPLDADPQGFGRLSGRRESALDDGCLRFHFEAIATDDNNELVVAEGEEAVLLAVLQLTFTPTMTHQGGWRASIKSCKSWGQVLFLASSCRRAILLAVDR